MLNRRLAFVFALGFAGVLAACSGGGTVGGGGGTCAADSLKPQLLYPIPGSTGVPYNVGLLIYSGTASAYQLTVTNGTMNAIVSPTSMPTTIPTPLASPTIPGAAIYYAAISNLTPNSSPYTVLYRTTAGCNAQFANFFTL